MVQSTPLPDFIAPQLATADLTPPAGDGWLHEEKYDGYRFIMRIDGERSIHCFTRNGRDWSNATAFATLRKELGAFAPHRCLLDGEVVAFNDAGLTSFQVLQGALGSGRTPVYFVAFDMLHLDGEDLCPLPLTRRKDLLEALFASYSLPHIERAPFFRGHGAEILSRARERGLEGIISKSVSSPYRSGRSLNWRKIKCVGVDDFIIGGFTLLRGDTSQIGALLLGTRDGTRGGQLHYCGAVGTGLNDLLRHELRAALQTMAVQQSPFDEPLPPPLTSRAVWVQPALTAQVRYTELTTAGILRHPTFLGIRLDRQGDELS